MDSIWESIHAQRAWGKYPNEELVRFIGRNYFKIPFEERKNYRILELGCGQGANLWFLAKEGFDTYGIDIAPSAIEKGEKFLEGMGINNVKLSVQDTRNLEFDDERFDVVIDVAAIWYSSFKDHSKIYKKIFDMLKKGGKFWSFHIAEGSWGYGKGTSVDYKTFENISEGILQNQGITCMPSDEDLRDLLTNNAFNVLSIEKYSITYQNQKNSAIYWIIESEKP